MKKLTLKQEKFVKYYVGEANGNGSLAARKAGYSITKANNEAYKNLGRPHVLTAIRQQLEGAGLSDTYVDESTRQIIEAGLKNARQAKPSVALQAIEMVNKLKDRFPASRNLNLNANLEFHKELEGKTIEELKQILAETQENTRQVLAKMN
ncbi:MAG: terminase small subunit [bacterium]|nr:terminase small subunit [bacterium]